MGNKSARFGRHCVVAALVGAVSLSGCQTAKKEPGPDEDAAAAAARAAKPEAAPPAPPEPPPLPPEEAKKQAQARALDALNALQAGEEEAALAALEQALKLDPTNELAKKLLPQITGDAQRDLGAQNFAYVVEPGDSLATIARRFLGDRYRFYSLAKYNDIKVPNVLAAGQTIKIPGKQPPREALKPTPTKPEPARLEPAAEPVKPEPAPAPEPAAKPKPDAARVDADKLVAQGRGLQAKGDLAGAMRAYDAARKRDPAHPEAARLYEAAKSRLVDNLDREAASLFSRQDLKGAIRKWDELLEIDPTNELAKLKRARAIDLQKRADEFDKR